MPAEGKMEAGDVAKDSGHGKAEDSTEAAPPERVFKLGKPLDGKFDL